MQSTSYRQWHWHSLVSDRIDSNKGESLVSIVTSSPFVNIIDYTPISGEKLSVGEIRELLVCTCLFC